MTSRQKLYALGEPFGDSCTRTEAGRTVYGGGGSSKSSSSNTTTTQNTDKRQVVDGGSVGVSSDSSTVNVSMLDQDAVKNAIDLVRDAGAASVEAYQDLLNATVVLNTQATRTLQANTEMAGQGTAQGTEETMEQVKKYLPYAAVGFAVYLATKKG